MQHDAQHDESAQAARTLDYLSPGAVRRDSLVPWVWLALFQLPSAIGILWFWSGVLGFRETGTWGHFAGMYLTFWGCLISGASALCFMLNTRVRKTARAVAILQGAYLALFIVSIAIMIGGNPSRGGGHGP